MPWEEGRLRNEDKATTPTRDFIERHAVLVFYVLVLALGLGPTLIFVGPGAFLATTNLIGTEAELDSAADLDPFMMEVIMAGNPVFALLGGR